MDTFRTNKPFPKQDQDEVIALNRLYAIILTTHIGPDSSGFPSAHPSKITHTINKYKVGCVSGVDTIAPEEFQDKALLHLRNQHHPDRHIPLAASPDHF
jgi:hypothetical protein